MNIKNLLSYLLAFTVGFSFVACDECASEDAGGAEGGAMGGAADCGGAAGGAMGGAMGGTMGGTMGGVEAGAGMMMQPAVYNVLKISDATGVDDDGNGTPGADICEIDIVCGGELLDATKILSVSLEISTPDCSASQGGACICAGTARDSDPNCGTKDRSDNAPASNDDNVRGLIYDGTNCPMTGADDAYVSLGANGTIVLTVAEDVNLADCTVTVDELGSDEDTLVEICDTNGDCDELM